MDTLNIMMQRLPSTSPVLSFLSSLPIRELHIIHVGTSEKFGVCVECVFDTDQPRSTVFDILSAFIFEQGGDAWGGCVPATKEGWYSNASSAILYNQLYVNASPQSPPTCSISGETIESLTAKAMLDDVPF